MNESKIFQLNILHFNFYSICSFSTNIHNIHNIYFNIQLFRNRMYKRCIFLYVLIKFRGTKLYSQDTFNSKQISSKNNSSVSKNAYQDRSPNFSLYQFKISRNQTTKNLFEKSLKELKGAYQNNCARVLCDKFK